MSGASSVTLQTFSDEIEKVAEEAGSSVVSVNSMGRAGTGVVWDEGHVVTAWHVVCGQDEVTISSGGKELHGVVKGHDERLDVALVAVEGRLSQMERGSSDGLKVGQFVLALANPYDGGVGATSGIITGVRKSIGGWWRFYIDEAIVSDARVNPGYSGGPLVNAAGQMIGMNVAYVSARAVAVPVNRIARIVDRIKAGGETGRPFLGITLNQVRVQAGNFGQKLGLIVLYVEQGSPADRAGLMLGDVLITIDGRAAAGDGSGWYLLDEDSIGREVKLGIIRAGKLLELTAVPEPLKED